MHAHRPHNVVDDVVPLLLGGLHLAIQGLLVKPLKKQAELSPLPVLPEEVREIAEQRLEEQDKDDPLIPRVSDLVPLGSHLDQVPVHVVGSAWVGSHPGVRVVHAKPPCELGGQGERSMDPAVGLEHAGRHAVHDAVDGVAEVLLGCLKEGSKAEQAKGDLDLVGFCLLVFNFLLAMITETKMFET